MNCTSFRIPYRQANAFSNIVLDYIDRSENLTPYYTFPPSIAGIQHQIEQRKNYATDRKTLVNVLNEQYKTISPSENVNKNINKLLLNNCFTITTAHQPNLFTGPLYFIYKILHTIKLAERLQQILPGNLFVPVFYMGSEDADLEELGHFYLDGEKKIWETKQTGAVGRMKVDKDLTRLIENVEGQLKVFPHGQTIMQLLKECYKEGETIQQATFKFVHGLFAQYGLVILIADHPALKKQMIPVFRDDLLNQRPSEIVQETSNKINQHYKVQANPREINLFYMKDEIRNRIEMISEDQFIVLDTSLVFTKDEILNELEQFPERFSPNVILRGLYQEMILPNISFIGGGGELAYWLQLKDLFNHYSVPLPVLVLRNSFLVIEEKWKGLMQKLKLSVDDLFLPVEEIINKKVKENSTHELSLNGTYQKTDELYEKMLNQVKPIDATLTKHVLRLQHEQIDKLKELEKKILRAEKKKFADQQRQIRKLKNHLFPKNGLQERYDNILYYFAVYGEEFIRELYDQSLTLDHEFCILDISKENITSGSII